MNRRLGHALGEQMLEVILDTMADPLFVKDREHRYVLCNRAMCEFMGQERDALIGKSDYDFFPADEARVFWAKDDEVFREGGVNVNQEQFTDRSGRTSVIVTKKTVFTAPDGDTILVGTIRDVTEQVQAEAELRRARDELELRVEQRTREVHEAHARLHQAQKMEAVGQLTGGIAHDFNNLLTVITGNLDLLAMNAMNAEAQTLIGEAINAAQGSAELIRRLLAFSRQQVLHEQATDIGALVERILPLIERSLGEDIRITTTIPPAQVCAEIDPSQLETALLNLSINARDAMPLGGQLSVEVTAIDLSSAEDEIEAGSWILIEVSDTGRGMSAEVSSRVFDPFFTTKGHRGSGLGLSMVYGFVKQSRGHVLVTSVVDAGTSLKVFLPRTNLGPEPEQPAARSDVVGGQESLLIVEDDATVRGFVVRVAASLGYEVAQAGTLDEAHELVRTLPKLDLLVTDVVLAEGPLGVRFAREVVAARPSCRVLLMSGYPRNADLDDAPMLSKPFRLRELAAAIRSVLDLDERR